MFNIIKNSQYAKYEIEEIIRGQIGFYCKKCFTPIIVNCDIYCKLYVNDNKIMKNEQSVDDLFITHNYQFDCPNCKTFCEWKDDPLDPNIAPMIAELNKKGFITYTSCEGHDDDINNSLPYILFKDTTLYSYINDYPLPNPWFLEEEDLCYYLKHDENNNEIKIKAAHISATHEFKLKDRMKSLNSWVKSLPNIRIC